MRRLVLAALLSAVTTFGVALALRAPDTTVAVAAVAALTVLVAWICTQNSDAETSGLALANPSSTVALTLVGRSPSAVLLPVVAAQLVGAVLAGLLAIALDDSLGTTLSWPEPTLVATGVVVAFLGVLNTWITYGVDAQVSEAFAAVPPLLAGAMLPLSLGAALNPAVVVGLATANLLPWAVAGVAAVVGTLAGVVGAYAVGVISPTSG